ncbi:putative multidrug resistance protein [Hibiscus syriacus]|uniref:Multidrug resistance protein n=1 Tax=Hibiscus syriacus TaxID=106335 RepID=A0A6A2YSW0_HIBSY|nr:putative multidrug resistance protein [Hibiscus syriacus]
MLSKILTFEVEWFDQDENSSGSVCSRLAKDSSVVRSLLGDHISLFMQTISGVTLACVMGLFITWRLALVMIVVQPLIILSFYTRKILLKSMSRKAIKAQQDSSKLAADAVSNHRTVTAFTSQDQILKMLEKAHERPRKENVRQSCYMIAEAASMTSDFANSSKVVASVFAILDHRTRIEPNDSNGYLAEEVTRCVEIHDVNFAYPVRPNVIILKDFSFTIEVGRSMALIDGRDLRSYNLRTLRKLIALVSQEPTAFSGTIRENILYGVSDETNESEVFEAANAHDFIAGLAEGYETWCGDRGVKLSGGQKQRIAIAQAILKNPTILLLDEATSALDSKSEKVVQEALERIMVGRTSVVVAHRLSTFRTAILLQ